MSVRGSEKASLEEDRSREHPPALDTEPAHAQKGPTKDLKKRKYAPLGRWVSSTATSVSMRSDCSREYPPVFSNEPISSQTGPTKDLKKRKYAPLGRWVSLTATSVSMRSDCSREYPPVFSNEPISSQTGPTKDLKKRKYAPLGRSVSLTDTSVSMRSDCSREYPPVFSNEPISSQTGPTKDLKKRKYAPLGRSVSLTDTSVSMRSDCSREYPPVFSNEPISSQTGPTKDLKKRKYAPLGRWVSLTATSVSMRSDCSREYPPVFSNEPISSQTGDQTTSGTQHNQEILKVFESKTMAFVKQALRNHMNVFSGDQNSLFKEDDQERVLDEAETDDETKEAALKIALHILRTMNETEHAQALEQSHYGKLVIYPKKLKSYLKKTNECILEDMTTKQWPVPLRKIYTQVCLLEGDSGGVNREHEVRQVETAFNIRKSSEILIKLEDIFKPLPSQQNTPVRTVLTKGIAGIGKTVLAQKFILDWAEEKANQDIQLLFSLPFRELNLIKNETRSLMELLHDFAQDLKKSGITDLKPYKVLFLLDGLDECRLPLNFKSNERCSDVTQSASVDALLTNLIVGNLLPEAKLWITTRPAAANCIPRQYVDRMTEIRGFNNVQKEQYFEKKIEDENLARRVIANIKSTRSLHIMCHVPVFCWISSIVLGKICAKAPGGKMPKTLTQMYIYFLKHQTTQMHVKYCKEQQITPEEKFKMILSLGKLAFQQLENGNLIFYEDDLRECGIDVKEASVYSGVCTQVFREESCMQHKVFSFVHLSVQEFLAALYVHVMYEVNSVNLLMENPGQIPQTKPLSDLHKAAVDRALQSDNGHLDLFLRFLLGLSMESSQSLLRTMEIPVENNDLSYDNEETIKYIKEKISQTSQPERYINLFHCLNELDDHVLVEEVQSLLDSGRDLKMNESTEAQWAALVFVSLTSLEKPEEFQLKKYSRTRKGLLKLLPVIKVSKSAMLDDCNLTADCCQEVSDTLSSSCNQLIQLNLSDNSLQDSGIKHLCKGLQSPQCNLKTLRLNRCGLTQRCCEKLALVLSHPSPHLMELDLSDNDIGDSGLQLLSPGLGHVCCKLTALRLSFCNITEEGCGFLASAVKSNPSHLSELDLSFNHLGESGVRLISEALEEGQCELLKFRVDHNAEHWFKPGLRQYACELTLDINTVHKLIVLSEDNQQVTQVTEEQAYPDHPDRFDYWTQVLIQEGLTGRCYWEVEWEGKWAGIGVTYKGISRKGPANDCLMGYNPASWSLHCSGKGYRMYHNFESITCSVPLDESRGLAVYLDWKAGILSFYRISPGRSLTHLHTFFTNFTEPLYPILRVWGEGSSVRLCQVK